MTVLVLLLLLLAMVWQRVLCKLLWMWAVVMMRDELGVRQMVVMWFRILIIFVLSHAQVQLELFMGSSPWLGCVAVERV